MKAPLNPFTNAVVVGSDMDPADYHEQGVPRGDAKYVLSRSALMEFYHCPHRWKRGFSRKEADALDWGNLVDCLVLQPKEFESRYAVTPETYPATPKKKGGPIEQKPWTSRAIFCSDWEEEREAEGKAILKYPDHLRAQTAADSLFTDAAAAPLLRVSSRQVLVSATYLDPATGLLIPVKALIDLVPSAASIFTHCLADLKTADSADQRLWRKAVFNYGYHVQAAFYLDIYNAATGEERDTFLHLIQESYPPYEVGHRFLTSEFLELGRMKYQNALARYADCVSRNFWPSYDQDSNLKWEEVWAACDPEPYMFNA